MLKLKTITIFKSYFDSILGRLNFGFYCFKKFCSSGYETKNLANYYCCAFAFRDLPRAVYITFAFATTMCVLANFAYAVIVTPYDMLQSDAVAVVRYLSFLSYFFPVPRGS